MSIEKLISYYRLIGRLYKFELSIDCIDAVFLHNRWQLSIERNPESNGRLWP